MAMGELKAVRPLTVPEKGVAGFSIQNWCTNHIAILKPANAPGPLLCITHKASEAVVNMAVKAGTAGVFNSELTLEHQNKTIPISATNVITSDRTVIRLASDTVISVQQLDKEGKPYNPSRWYCTFQSVAPGWEYAIEGETVDMGTVAAAASELHGLLQAQQPGGPADAGPGSMPPSTSA